MKSDDVEDLGRILEANHLPLLDLERDALAKTALPGEFVRAFIAKALALQPGKRCVDLLRHIDQLGLSGQRPADILNILNNESLLAKHQAPPLFKQVMTALPPEQLALLGPQRHALNLNQDVINEVFEHLESSDSEETARNMARAMPVSRRFEQAGQHVLDSNPEAKDLLVFKRNAYFEKIVTDIANSNDSEDNIRERLKAAIGRQHIAIVNFHDIKPAIGKVVIDVLSEQTRLQILVLDNYSPSESSGINKDVLFSGLRKIGENNPRLRDLELLLGYNYLGREDAAQLAAVLKSEDLGKLLGRLVLTLMGNRIGPEGASDLFESLRNLPLLRELGIRLPGNGLIASNVRQLADALMNKKDLTLDLDLRFNAIGDHVEGLADLLNTKGACRDLVLWLDDTQMTYIGVNMLSEALKSYKGDLKGLRLSDNPIGENGLVPLFEALKGNRTLRILELALNNTAIGNSDVTALCEALEANRNAIRKITMQKNNFGDPEAIMLAGMLNKNPLVKRLDLAKNNITDRGTGTALSR